METKDVVTLSVSAAAFIVSFASFYFSQIHKPSGAVLILLERLFTPEKFTFVPNASPYVPMERRMRSPTIRHLKYSLSNTGKQTLYVKDIEVLQGPDVRGNLKSHGSFTILSGDPLESFLIEPGDIKIIEISHPKEFQFPEGYDFEENCYELVSLVVVSADGNRYQICHDITKLGTHGPDIHHPIWDGTTLGSPVRGSGFV
ncbi:hypothetical protein PMHK_34890 [Pseudomonas sp. MHK4]